MYTSVLMVAEQPALVGNRTCSRLSAVYVELYRNRIIVTK